MVICTRLISLLLTVVAASAVVFWVMNVLPGDPALTILGIESTADAQAALRARLGLDVPAWQRYFQWLGNFARGDFGTSYMFDEPVAQLIAQRLPVTLPLALSASLLTVGMGVGTAVFAASRHRRAGDLGTMVVSQIGMAVPVFWLSALLILMFAIKLPWLPPGGFPGWGQPMAAVKALILPTVAVALVQSAFLARVSRTSILEVMGLGYVRFARALGLSPRRTLWGHSLPNALAPMITIIGVQLANVVTGVIVVENVFSLPGLGRLLVQSINNRDLFTVQALVMIFAVVVIVINYMVDILCVLIDPRLRQARP